MAGGGGHDIRCPVERGQVKDWLGLEKLLHHVMYREMTCIPEESAVMLLDAPGSTIADREETASILFEKMSTPHCYLMMQSVAAMIASGRTQGLVLDAGHGVTHVTPISEGLALPYGVVRHQLGGSDIDKVLKDLLAGRGVMDLPEVAVRDMKERLCQVALDFNKELPAAGEANSAGYQLPDGRVITLQEERLVASECWFNPSEVERFVGPGVETPTPATGVQEAISESLYQLDAELRKKVWDTVVLAGGCTLTNGGFAERLERELPTVLPQVGCGRCLAQGGQGCNMRVVAPPTRKYSPWIGGSIAGSLDSFNDNQWVSLTEYNECGTSVLQRRLYW